MPFTVAKYYESRTGVAAHANVAGLADTSLSVSGDNITVPPTYNQIIAAWAAMSNAADTLVAARVSAPSMKMKLDLANIEVIAAGATVEPSSPTPLDVHLDSPIQLVSGEFMQFSQVSDGTTAANLCHGVVLLGDGNYSNPYQGLPVMTVRGTGATTLTANAWTAVTVTLNQQLEAGQYALIGMRAQSAGAQVARVILSNSGARPGCIAYDSNADIENPMFRKGHMGVWGTFVHTAIPQVEMVSLSADTAEVFYFDIVKIG
jgi:hypothetical protein